MPADDDVKRPSGHTLADHLYGQDLMHVHEGDADHDHDWIDEDERLEDNPLWIQDHVTLNTVGIDIGSAGTQIIFSRINLRRLGEDLSSRYYVVSRETLFQSPVALTPYSSEERIDERKLGEIIDAAYDVAKIHPDDIDTGVVILTGEALRRENAQAIAAGFCPAAMEISDRHLAIHIRLEFRGQFIDRAHHEAQAFVHRLPANLKRIGNCRQVYRPLRGANEYQ